MRFKLFNRKKQNIEYLPMCESDKDGIKIQVIRINHRPFYDSEWRVNVTVDNTNNYSTKITRDETESAEALEAKVRAFGKGITFENIQSLDEKANIYYD
jgi:hypothetical protein